MEGYWETAKRNPLLVVGHHGVPTGSADSPLSEHAAGLGLSGSSAVGMPGVHRCCAQTSDDAVGQLDRKTKENGEGWGTLGALLVGHPGGVDPITSTASDAWARRCPDGAHAAAGNATAAASDASPLDASSVGSGAASVGEAFVLKTEVKHALHAIESKLENVLAGHVGAGASDHHHHSGHAAEAHTAETPTTPAHAQAPPYRSSAGVAWTNVTGERY